MFKFFKANQDKIECIALQLATAAFLFGVLALCVTSKLSQHCL